MICAHCDGEGETYDDFDGGGVAVTVARHFDAGGASVSMWSDETVGSVGGWRPGACPECGGTGEAEDL